MNAVDVIVMLALIQYLVFGALVGKARIAYGIKAPAVVGHEQFERRYRVQMNTLELLVAFVPAAYAAARYWPAPLVVAAGILYLAARVLYWRAYVRDPRQRSLGFVLSALPVFALALSALAGAAMGRGVA